MTGAQRTVPAASEKTAIALDAAGVPSGEDNYPEQGQRASASVSSHLRM